VPTYPQSNAVVAFPDKSDRTLSGLPSTITVVQSRNKAHNRRNAAKVEQYLMEVERVHGCSKSWALREQFERGDVTLGEFNRH
jgi:hypothetical protein